MIEHLAAASGRYGETRKVILEALGNMPAKEEELSALAASVYSGILLAGQEVDGISGIAKEILVDEAAALKMHYEAAWIKVSQMPATVGDRIKFVRLMGQSLPFISSAITLLEAMEAKRLQHSKVRASKIDKD
jgi:hypothetical protein